MNIFLDYAKANREEAARLDRLADAAKLEGDTWDEAELRAKAVKLRREARRYEIK